MKYDVIVAGGGAAGLTAAAYAARAGRSVALFEKQPVLGGLVQSVNCNGFIFDMGLRAVEDSGIVLPMVAELGLPLRWVKSRVSLGIRDRVITVDSEESLEAYRRLLKSFYPASGGDIDAIVSVIRRIMRDMDVLYGIENPLFKDLRRDRAYLFGTLLPWMGKFVFTIGRINRMDTPIEQFLDGLTRDGSLKSMVGQHFFRRTPAFFAMSYFSVYLDYLYPEGGTGTLMRLLAGYAAERGTEILLNTPVIEVNPETRTVTDGNGGEHTYGSLIWCADLRGLYGAVMTDAIANPRIRNAVESRRAELQRYKGGDSVFSVFLSVDETPDSFRKISEGHFFYTPDPRGLGDLSTKGLDELLERYDGFGNPRQEVKSYIGRLLALNTFEISIPVLKDPALAPPGKTGLIVSWLFDYTLMKKIREDGWYDECEEFCMDRVVMILSASVYPGLEKKILSRFAATPLTIEEHTGSTQGAITGWAFTGAGMPVVNKMQQVSRSVLTPMEDVYQAGQWAYSPSGLPIAILTGKLAANRAMKRRV